MHGRVCERRHKSRRRHMLISSSRVIATVEGGGSSCLSLSSSTSFSKVNSIRFRFDCPQAVLFSCSLLVLVDGFAPSVEIFGILLIDSRKGVFFSLP